MKKRYAFDGIRAQIRDLRTENIAVLAARAKALGDVIPLWFGEGDVVTPPFIREAAKAAIDDGLTFYIPNMRGYAPLIEELSTYQSRIHGRPIAVERSTIAPGGMQALYLALTLLVDVGTNVVYVAPQWPNIHSAIHLVGGEPRPVALGFDTDWRLDLDKLFAACDARTRAIFLSTPSNPTGWTASREEMQALLDFSRWTGIWIISDEVYNRLYFDGVAAPSILQLAEDGDRVLAVNSFSKAWAMTGWRIGWMVMPARLTATVDKLIEFNTSGAQPFLQRACVVAIQQGEPFLKELVQRYAAARELVLQRLGGMRRVRIVRPEAAFYVMFGVDGMADSLAFAKRLPPWVYYALAAVIAAGLIYRAGWNARDEKADSEQAQMVAAYEQAQAEALRLAIAAREAQEARYRDLAKRIDTDAQDARNQAADAVTRYIVRNRVQPCTVGSAGSTTPASTEGGSASGSVGTGAPAIVDAVAVSEADIRICTDNTARLVAAREWALGLAGEN